MSHLNKGDRVVKFYNGSKDININTYGTPRKGKIKR